MLGPIPGLHPLDKSSTTPSVIIIQAASRHQQESPGVKSAHLLLSASPSWFEKLWPWQWSRWAWPLFSTLQSSFESKTFLPNGIRKYDINWGRLFSPRVQWNPQAHPPVVGHHTRLCQDCDSWSLKRWRNKSDVVVLLVQSVPGIQSYMFIKMYSPVTMTTLCRLRPQRRDKEWLVVFFFCSCIVPEFCLSRLPK